MGQAVSRNRPRGTRIEATKEYIMKITDKTEIENIISEAQKGLNDFSGAEGTSRVLPDNQSDLLEAKETFTTVKGQSATIFYMVEKGADWDMIDWEDRIDHIIIDEL